jgi:hypothetical protein
MSLVERFGSVGVRSPVVLAHLAGRALVPTPADADTFSLAKNPVPKRASCEFALRHRTIRRRVYR